MIESPSSKKQLIKSVVKSDLEDSLVCQFCGSKRRVKQYLKVWNAGFPNGGDICTERVNACGDCTAPHYGGSETQAAPKTANL